jgi:peroxiredoxin
MDVTTENFETILTEIEEFLPKVFLISMDMEFSGLRQKSVEKISRVDTISERYQKIKNAKEFTVFQVGMCFWFFEEEK